MKALGVLPEALIGLLALAALAGCSLMDSPPAAAPQTALEAADAVRCPRGLNRIVRSGGREDDFDTRDAEPSRIRAARLPNPFLEAIAAAQSGTVRLRGYDEVGQDRILIDHFELPRGIVSGALVLRYRASGGTDNDKVRIGNLDENAFADGYNRTDGFAYRFAQHPADAAESAAGKSTVITVPFDQLDRSERTAFKGSVIDFLNRADRPDTVDFEVDDDTAVDVAMLVLCQQPEVAMGTTFSEFHAKLAGLNISFLACSLDKTQAPCNPFQGDRMCTAPLPVACYKPGSRVPTGMTKAGLEDGFAAGGTVRMSVPVAASQFRTISAANAYCTAQFGADWRILEYHDASGGGIITYSDVAPKTRAWVDVQDQRYGNCWDRDTQR